MCLKPVKYDNLILCFAFHNLFFFEKNLVVKKMFVILQSDIKIISNQIL